MLEVVRRKHLERGVLIAIEGIEGTGKTTQSQILLDRLTGLGYPATGLHEPTDGRWGRKIRGFGKEWKT